MELGWKFNGARFSATTAIYAMRKDLILRGANSFSVGDGSTRHRNSNTSSAAMAITRVSLNGTYASTQPRSRARSKAYPSSTAMMSTPHRLICTH